MTVPVPGRKPNKKGPRKASYACEVMLRVSWSVLNHEDGQPPHTRRGEVMLDLGLEVHPNPELTRDEMQQVAFAAKIAALKALAARRRAPRPMTLQDARAEAKRRWFRMQDKNVPARLGFVSLLRKDKPRRYEVGLRCGSTTLSSLGESWEGAFAAMDRLEADITKGGGQLP